MCPFILLYLTTVKPGPVEEKSMVSHGVTATKVIGMGNIDKCSLWGQASRQQNTKLIFSWEKSDRNFLVNSQVVVLSNLTCEMRKLFGVLVSEFEHVLLVAQLTWNCVPVVTREWASTVSIWFTLDQQILSTVQCPTHHRHAWRIHQYYVEQW